jgi:hypothetical protein
LLSRQDENALQRGLTVVDLLLDPRRNSAPAHPTSLGRDL